MASQMEWSHEFCLSCDRQIAEGVYCSQACRLADLEKAGTAEPQTPSQLSSSASSTGSSSSHGFYLPPAVNFTALKTPSTSRGFDLGPSASHYYSSGHASYFAQQPSTASTSSKQPHQQQRSLTPSSSRSSLTSAASQTASGISLQAAHQLNSYSRAFDHARDVRRMSRKYSQY